MSAAKPAPAKRTHVTPAASTPQSVKVESSAPLAKRAKRLGYDLPEVPAPVEDVAEEAKLVTAEASSPLGKRAKRKGYKLPSSPETVVAEATVSVPFGGNKS